MKLSDADWTHIGSLREEIEAAKPTSVEEAARRFVGSFHETFPSIVLARLFLVMPFEKLPQKEKSFAIKVAGSKAKLTDHTPVLALLGTAGVDSAWNDRTRSSGHLAIPLIDRSFVAEAPMIAKLLADLSVDLGALDDAFATTSQRMFGANNGKFFVDDATTAVDARGRFVIPNREFVTKNGVRTVFGMGGSYYDGTMAVGIFFTKELLDRTVTDRYASFISTFKMRTTRLQQSGHVFAT